MQEPKENTGQDLEVQSKPEVLDLGRIDYRTAWQVQLDTLDDRIADRIPDTLIVCEHPPVITLGRGAQRGEKPLLIPNPGVEVVEIERGGLATYHSLGQLVIYPIFKLSPKDPRPSRQGVVGLIRSLEAWMIDYFSSRWKLRADRSHSHEGDLNQTGVWIDQERKIASIGIACRRWVSFHGLAMNLQMQMEEWRQINPCGYNADLMTDLSKEIGKDINFATEWAYLRNSAQEFF